MNSILPLFEDDHRSLILAVDHFAMDYRTSPYPNDTDYNFVVIYMAVAIGSNLTKPVDSYGEILYWRRSSSELHYDILATTNFILKSYDDLNDLVYNQHHISMAEKHGLLKNSLIWKST